LGLSINRELVKLLNGEISLTSEPDQALIYINVTDPKRSKEVVPESNTVAENGIHGTSYRKLQDGRQEIHQYNNARSNTG